MTDPVDDRGTDELGLESPVMLAPATGGFFQRAGTFRDVV
jgi:hypothetical protein